MRVKSVFVTRGVARHCIVFLLLALLVLNPVSADSPTRETAAWRRVCHIKTPGPC